jgi:uncharacterized protein YgbK (DUF1537 family)
VADCWVVVAGQEDAHLLVDADVGDEPLVRGQGGLRYGVARVRCLEQRARELWLLKFKQKIAVLIGYHNSKAGVPL